jgi:outer membrane protein OmpA-like peptidoglycan-associated protein
MTAPEGGGTVRMRCHPFRWLWGLIPIVMLGWIAVDVERGRIEHDLESRATQALRQAGHGWASIAFSGRDGILVGTAPRREASRNALELARGVWGVRVVEGRTRLAERATAMVLPLPNPERGRTRKDSQKASAPPQETPRKDASLRELPHKDEPRKDEPRGAKSALPPLSGTIVVSERADATVTDARPFALGATAPAAIAELHPEAVPAWESAAALAAPVEPDAATLKVQDNELPTGAQKPQAETRLPSVETAAIAQTAAEATEACKTAVHAINITEPVRFALGKTALDGADRGVLDRLAVMAASCPEVGLKVVGHADARGPAKRNLVLSQRRARAVVAYLIQKGIDAGRLEAVGYGEAHPVAPNDTARNRAKNRRIEVEIAGAAGQVPPTRQGAGNGLPDR